MSASTIALISLLLTLVLFVIGKFLTNLSGRLKESTEANTRLHERIDKSEQYYKDSIRISCQEVQQNILHSKAESDSRISFIEKNAVFKDLFSQYKETQDTKFRSFESMLQLHAEQQKAMASANSAEHGRICGKMDALPQIIRDEVRATIAMAKSGGIQ